MSLTAAATFSLSGPLTLAATVNVTYRGSTGWQRIELTGVQTYTIDLAMMPAAGLKILRVEVDTTDAAGAAVTAPVTLTWTSNAVSKSEQLGPGGAFQKADPSPVNSVTALSIVSSANAVVHVLALG